MNQESELSSVLQQAIQQDAYDVLGMKHRPILRTVLDPFFRPLFRRFADLLASFEWDVQRTGFKSALAGRLPQFVHEIEVSGIENVPADGPLLLASNHPGAYDALIIATLLPRDDLKIIATDVDLIHHLPAAAEHFAFIGKADKPDIHQGMSGARQSIRHLRQGGALLIFPGRFVDPDPALQGRNSNLLHPWQPGVDLLIRKVPQTAIVICIVSGVLASRWARSPVTRLRKEPHNRQKVAEIFQVIEQLLFPGLLRLSPKVSFSLPIISESLEREAAVQFPGQYLFREAEQLLAIHRARFYPL